MMTESYSNAVLLIATRPQFVGIPRSQAVYCENCDTVSNSRLSQCGSCGSRELWPVSRSIQRHKEALPTPRPIALASSRPSFWPPAHGDKRAAGSAAAKNKFLYAAKSIFALGFIFGHVKPAL